MSITKKEKEVCLLVSCFHEKKISSSISNDSLSETAEDKSLSVF